MYREIKRNASKTGLYIPEFANELANEKKERFRQVRKFDSFTQKTVLEYLKKTAMVTRTNCRLL